MNKLLLLTLASALSLGASAQTALPYESSMFVKTSTYSGTIDEGWISVDLDTTYDDNFTNQSWKYGTTSFMSSAAAAQIQVARAYAMYNKDWLISPIFHLEAGREYKLAWNDCINNYKNLGYKVAMALNVTDEELATLQETNADATYETALTSRLADEPSFSKAMAPVAKTTTARAETISVTTTGDYRIGFYFCIGTPSADGSTVATPTGGSLWLNGFSLAENILKPAAVTDLTATTDAENMTVTLAWTLPTLDDTGAALAEGALTAVNVYRGDELIATLDGTATTYTDNLEDAGFYTYSVAAVATAEGDAVSVSTDYIGTIGAQALPYSDDFSDTQMTPLLWSAIDANADGTTWSYYNSYGTTYYTYETYLTSTVEDDWLVSPALYFDKEGVYNLSVNASCFNGHLTFAVSSEKTAEALADEAAKIGENTYSGYSGVTKEFDFDVTKAGNYFIGIRNDANPSNAASYKVTKFEIKYQHELESAAINSVAVDARQADNAVYNLQGMRVSNPGNGLFIVNGKKTILK